MGHSPAARAIRMPKSHEVRRYREEGIKLRLLQHQKLGSKSREAYSSRELCLVPVKIIADWSQQRNPRYVNHGWLTVDD